MGEEHDSPRKETIICGIMDRQMDFLPFEIQLNHILLFSIFRANLISALTKSIKQQWSGRVPAHIPKVHTPAAAYRSGRWRLSMAPHGMASAMISTKTLTYQFADFGESVSVLSACGPVHTVSKSSLSVFAGQRPFTAPSGVSVLGVGCVPHKAGVSMIIDSQLHISNSNFGGI
jgi:hypothetical protein